MIFKNFHTILIFIILLSCNEVWSQRILKQNDSEEILKQRLDDARIKKDYPQIAKSYYKLGEYYQYRKNDLEKAFHNYLIARQYFVRISDFDYIKYIDEFVADRNISLGFFEEGLSLYEELVSYYIAKGDSASVAIMYHKCSKAAKQRGDIEAQINYQNKLTSYKSSAGTGLILSMMIDKIENYIQLKERDSALITAIETAKIASRSNNNQALS